MYPLTAPKLKKDPINPGIGTLGTTATPTPSIASPTATIARPTPKPMQPPNNGAGLGGYMMPNPLRPPPAISQPGSIARGTANAIATGADIATAPVKAIGDVLNRTAIGVRNFGANAVGLPSVEPASVNYGATRDALDNVRQRVAAPAAIAQPTPQPAAAAPSVRFAGVDPAPGGMFQRPTSTASNPSQPAVISSPSPVLHPGDLNTFTGSNGRTSAVPGMSSPATGSVESQSFGTSVPIARPTFAPLNAAAKASTYGLPVNDPRLNDQTATIQRPGQLALNPNGNAESFNAREDRDARQKQAGDIDTQLFMLRGKTDPESLRAMTELTQTKARLASGGEQLSADAVQGRAGRENAFGIADLVNQGDTRRTQIGADVTREGNQLGYRQGMAQVGASLIARPELKQDDSGTYFNVTGSKADRVVDSEGNPVRGQLPAIANPRNYQQEADDAFLSDLIKTKVDAVGNPLPNAVELAQQDLQKIRGQGQQAKPPAAYPDAKRAPDGKWYVQKNGSWHHVE